MRKELKRGISLLVIFSILHVILNAPELLKGFLVGLGWCFIIIGTLPEKTYFRLKNWNKTVT